MQRHTVADPRNVYYGIETRREGEAFAGGSGDRIRNPNCRDRSRILPVLASSRRVNAASKIAIAMPTS
jgi:hypothetical protein